MTPDAETDCSLLRSRKSVNYVVDAIYDGVDSVVVAAGSKVDICGAGHNDRDSDLR
jgi:coenzyme F420-reducing hydrogenase delta subunit